MNMSKHHVLKIEKQYFDEKFIGNKLFEIRNNDRDFKVGDLVSYHVLGSDIDMSHMVFEISYVTDFEQKNGYVVFGEKLIKR